MTGTTVHIPTLETERLILRAHRMGDFVPFANFMDTERSQFVGGPIGRRFAIRGIGHAAGLWITRGYSLFVAERKDAPGTPIGMVGPWYPIDWPELEFGWSLWDSANEGLGFVTEAMRTLIPWAWGKTTVETAVSYIDETNTASIRVAEALGAVLDTDSSEKLNQPGSPFYEKDGDDVLAYRHTKGALK